MGCNCKKSTAQTSERAKAKANARELARIRQERKLRVKPVKSTVAK